MVGLAIVRGAGKGKLRIGKGKPIGRARFDQGKRLHQFDRRSRKNRPFDIADGEYRRTLRIHDRNGAAVAAFDCRTTRHLDQFRICHGRSVRVCVETKSIRVRISLAGTTRGIGLRSFLASAQFAALPGLQVMDR